MQTRRAGRRKRGGAHLLELPLGDAVAVEDDAGGLETRGLVELDEQLAHHGRQVLDDLLPVLLHAHGGTVAVRVGIHAAHDLRGSGVSRRPEGRHGQAHHLYAASVCLALVYMNVSPRM